MGITSRVQALNDSAVQLTITPRLCVVDVVEDGSNQTVQTASSECEPVLPDAVSQKDQRTQASSAASPFASQTNTLHLAQPPAGSHPAPIPRASKKSEGRERPSMAEKSRGAIKLVVAAFGALAAAVIFATVRARWLRR
jgi:hypothetical protein